MVIGAVLSACIFGVLLATDPLFHDPKVVGGIYRVRSYKFFDLQAHSLLQLRWDVPRDSIGLEAFVLHGKTYMYWGPFPALLRLPIAAVTDSLDGLTGPFSMAAAFAVLMFFTVRLTTRMRTLVRGDATVTRGERWAVGGFVFVVGTGSVVVFLASRAWVYHEAELWGLTLALGAFGFMIDFASDPRRRSLVLAGALTTLAVLTRGTSGLGPMLALALLLGALVVPRLRTLVGLADAPRGQHLVALCTAALVLPVTLYCSINYAKFGSLFSVPWMDQLSRIIPQNQAMLQDNNGTWFGLKFVPHNLLQYVRPDALRPSAYFPWWKFGPPAASPSVYQPTGSVTATMPGFVILAALGAVGAIRGNRQGGARLAALRAPLIGATLGTFSTLYFAGVAQRYLSDFVPGLLVGSVAGLHLVLRWSAQEKRRSVRRLAWSGLAIAALLGIWINVGLTILYSRNLEPHTPVTVREEFIDFQHRIHDVFPGGDGRRARINR